MKRTTYIFIGILASVLVILMAGVVYISFQKSDRDSYILTFSDKLLQTEFSGRDHSTIVYSLKTMERDMKNDQHLRETVSDIIKNVKA